MKSGCITAISIAILAVGTTTWAGGPGPTIPGPGIDPGLGERLKEQERQKLLPKTAPLPKRPDLVVTTFETIGRATVVRDHVEVPVRVVVKNQGTAEAPVFKTGVQLVPSGPLRFAAPGSRDDQYWTTATLAAGSSATFEGRVTFGPTDRHKTVSIRAVADSCDPVEFMPAYCRVQESTEGNNMSSPVSVALP